MEKISPAILTFLLNATWQVAMVGGLASIAARLLQAAPARYRHMVWVTALFFAVLLPATNLVRLAPRTPARQSTATTATVQLPEVVDETSLALPTTASHKTANPLRTNFPIPATAAEILAGLYVAFILFRFLGLVRAWWLTRALIRGSALPEFPLAAQRVIARCLAETGATNVRFLSSASLSAPMTVGFAPAVIVVPEKLVHQSDEAILTCAIGHELVHVQRKDYLWNLVYRALAIPLSFHPAAALIRRRIDETRELRCDEVVTERLLSPAAYARSLVELAGAAHALRRPATVAVGIADADILEERIMSMLKKRSVSTGRRTLLVVAAALVITAPCIAAVPYALQANVQTPVIAMSPAPVAAAQPPAPAVPAITSEPAQEPKQAAEPKTIMFKTMAPEVGVAFYPATQEQSGAESEARLKRKREEQARAFEERNMTPEERAAREKAIREKLAMRAKELAELSKTAKITMQQAIEIALRQQPGTVMESSLMGERVFVTKNPDGTFSTISGGENASPNPLYRVVILSGEESAPVRTIVIVSAIDGTVIKSVVE